MYIYYCFNVYYSFIIPFSHQIMTYTHQLVSDTNNQLKEVDKCKERHLKIQRDRLVDEFTAALTSFQVSISLFTSRIYVLYSDYSS